jgi:hypothetical protein
MPSVALNLYARICGWTLAWAHARSGNPVVEAGDRSHSLHAVPPGPRPWRARMALDPDLTGGGEVGRLPAVGPGCRRHRSREWPERLLAAGWRNGDLDPGATIGRQRHNRGIVPEPLDLIRLGRAHRSG